MTWKNRAILFFSAIGVVCVLGLGSAYFLQDFDSPGEANYHRCLNRVARQAEGNMGIFNVLRWEQCEKLEPNQKTDLFDDLAPKKELSDSEVFGGPWKKYQTQKNTTEFLNHPLKPVIDPSILKSLNKQAALQFHGYGCTNDCSGHQAGYRWAERKNIEEEDDCTGKSQSFIEGCMAYVEENK